MLGKNNLGIVTINANFIINKKQEKKSGQFQLTPVLAYKIFPTTLEFYKDIYEFSKVFDQKLMNRSFPLKILK